MVSTRILSSVLLAFFASAAALAVPTSRAESEAASVDKLFQGKGPAVVRSVNVVRLSDGKTLYSKDGDLLVAPASVTKVITTAAVLTRFTPVHTFRTTFHHSGSRKNDKILGDLIAVGDGDPYLVSEKLWQLAADLRNMGVRDISGDLVIDNSLFAGAARDDSRKSGAAQSSNAYDAPVTAFGVNFNTFAVAIAPGEAPGKPALVGIDPYPLRNVAIENAVKTVKARAGRTLDLKRSSGGEGSERITASGTIAQDAQIYKIYRSVGNPVIAAGEYVKAFFKSEGIIIRGGVKEGRKPADAKLLYELESYEMRRIVAGLNTFSNNYVADVLVKRLGAAFPRSGAPDSPGSGSYENGLAAIRDFLRKDVGIKSEFVIENGSGLATENRLSAKQITDVLTYMEKRMEVFPEFLASLPATGWDGTLKKRFGKSDTNLLKGLVRAKTGTLSEPISVSGLAGYFRHPKHGMVAFCILENGQQGSTQPSITDLRERQDKALVSFMNDI